MAKAKALTDFKPRLTPVFRVKPTQVLIAGGNQTAQVIPLNTAEVFDSASRTFAATTSMSSARSNHAAVGIMELSSAHGVRGVVLLAGGVAGNSAPSAKAEVFAAGAFVAASDLHQARDGAVFGQVQRGPLVIIGGKTALGALASTERVAVSSQSAYSFESDEPMGSSRVGHTVTPIRRGAALLVVGGFNGDLSSHFPINDVEVYLRQPNSTPPFAFFPTAGSLSVGRAFHATALLADGRVLVTGGAHSNLIGEDTVHQDFETFDPANELFTQTSRQMRSKRAFHTATTLFDGRVLVAGGSNGSSVVATTELYDPDGQRFGPGPNLRVARRLHTATSLSDGTVLIAGGRGANGEVLDSAEIFVPSDPPTFVDAGKMTSARWGHSATAIPSPFL